MRRACITSEIEHAFRVAGHVMRSVRRTAPPSLAYRAPISSALLLGPAFICICTRLDRMAVATAVRHQREMAQEAYDTSSRKVGGEPPITTVTAGLQAADDNCCCQGRDDASLREVQRRSK